MAKVKVICETCFFYKKNSCYANPPGTVQVPYVHENRLGCREWRQRDMYEYSIQDLCDRHEEMMEERANPTGPHAFHKDYRAAWQVKGE